MDTEFTENTGKKERYKKEDDDVTIWYEQKIRYRICIDTDSENHGNE